MSTTRSRASLIPELHRLIQRALFDLKRARSVGDSLSAERAERRMNAMLDQLTKRLSRSNATSG